MSRKCNGENKWEQSIELPIENLQYAVSKVNPSTMFCKLGPYVYPRPVLEYTAQGYCEDTVYYSALNLDIVTGASCLFELGMVHKTIANAKMHNSALLRYAKLQSTPNET